MLSPVLVLAIFATIANGGAWASLKARHRSECAQSIMPLTLRTARANSPFQIQISFNEHPRLDGAAMHHGQLVDQLA